MADLSIALVYFSATHVTQTYAEEMQETLLNQGCLSRSFNVTPSESRQHPLSFDDYNGVIFGFPVFADFAPTVINQWLPTLEGKGKKCSLFFTYGARSTGYAHFHTKLLLDRAGFKVLFTAEFIGRHSFNVGGWKNAPDRPNEADLAVAREYAQLAVSRFAEEAPRELRLQKPSGYNQVLAALEHEPPVTERQWKHPVRIPEGCSMCRDCEAECPTRAFDADTGLSDPRTCIGCMHCVTICPDNALRVDAMQAVYPVFLANWHLTDEMMQAKKSKIITESWQAGC